MTKSRKHAATSRGMKAYKLNSVLKNNGWKFYGSHFKGQKGNFWINLANDNFVLYCKGIGAVLIDEYGQGTMRNINNMVADLTVD